MKFKAVLETKGRDTGKMHRVWLLAVKYEGKLYFSRRNTNSDWLKNAQKNPDVRIEFDGQGLVEVIFKKFAKVGYVNASENWDVWNTSKPTHLGYR